MSLSGQLAAQVMCVLCILEDGNIDDPTLNQQYHTLLLSLWTAIAKHGLLQKQVLHLTEKIGSDLDKYKSKSFYNSKIGFIRALFVAGSRSTMHGTMHFVIPATLSISEEIEASLGKKKSTIGSFIKHQWVPILLQNLRFDCMLIFIFFNN